MEVNDVSIGKSNTIDQRFDSKLKRADESVDVKSAQVELKVKDKVELERDVYQGRSYTPEERRDQSHDREKFVVDLKGGESSRTLNRQVRDNEKVKARDESVRKEIVESSNVERGVQRYREVEARQEKSLEDIDNQKSLVAFNFQAADKFKKTAEANLEVSRKRVDETQKDFETRKNLEAPSQERSEEEKDNTPVTGSEPQISTSKINSEQFSVLMKQQMDHVEYFTDRGYVSTYEDNVRKDLEEGQNVDMKRFLDDLQSVREQQNIRSLDDNVKNVEKSGNIKVGGNLDFEI